MAAPMDHVQLSKSQKKAAKKQYKNRQTLFKRNGIIPTDIPTNHLVVANGGLDNNVSYEELHRAFQVYGEVVDIVMQPQKSYAFVSMSSTAELEAAFVGLHGQALTDRSTPGSSEVILYLDYVDSVPGVSVPSNQHPPGLVLLEDVVSEDEEQELLATILWDQIDANMSTDAVGTLKHRRVKHYGYEFMYSTNNIDRSRPLEYGLPASCQAVTDRLTAAGHTKVVADQLTVNQYEPGQGIPPHVDTHSAFEDEIVSVSLGSQCVMEFTHPDGHQLSVLLPKRSALIMSGEARYLWTHGITPRRSDIVTPTHPGGAGRLTLCRRTTRTSLTFRKIRAGPCACKFPKQCDSQQAIQRDDSKKKKSILQLPKSDQEAERIEKAHVHQVYEEIADHFSDTRHSPWPRVAEFLQQQPEGAIVVDVGCGNGKYLGVNKACFNMGCDRSTNLCSICCDRGHSVFVADCLRIPLRAGTADVAISIAVIHHLSTWERRQQAVQQIVNVLRPGGQALIYVWALEQEKDKIKSNYLKDTRIKRKDYLHTEEEAKLQGTAEISRETSCKALMEHQHQQDLNSAVSELGKLELSPDVKKHCTELDSVRYLNRTLCGSQNGAGTNVVEKADEIVDDTMSYPTPAIEGSTNQADADLSSGAPCHDLRVHVNRTHFEEQDLLVPWHNKPQQQIKAETSQAERHKVVHRFYHVFQEGELEDLCVSVTGVQLIRRYYDKGNWCVVLQKDNL